MDSIETLVIGMFCGAGLFFLLWKAIPRVMRAWGYHLPRNQAEKQATLERKAVVAVQAALDFARAKADLAEEVGGDLPKEFDPGAYFGFQVAAAVEREYLLHAEREGLINPGDVDRLFQRHGHRGRDERDERDDLSDARAEDPDGLEPPGAFGGGFGESRVTVRRVGGKVVPIRRRLG